MSKDFAFSWIKRADEILAKGHAGHFALAGEMIQFCTSLLTTVYGPSSKQLSAFNQSVEAISKKETSPGSSLVSLCRGTIQNTKSEIELGLVENIRVLVSGEVLGEMLRISKEILSEESEQSVQVGAVLTAAAFEAILRKMAEELAGVRSRPKLEEIIGILKEKQLLKGGETATAQGFLKFRNDSLHADWKNVHKTLVLSCHAFSESILLKHFS